MDEDGFTTWATGVQPRLLRAAYLLTGDRHRAEDLVQDALLKVALRWTRLQQGNPTAYARRILVNDNASWWRRRREYAVPEPQDAPVHDDDPLVSLVVRRALSRLTPRQRAVLVLRHLEDLSEREVAEALGVSVGTVKSQNAAALARLRGGAPELDDLMGRLT